MKNEKLTSCDTLHLIQYNSDYMHLLKEVFRYLYCRFNFILNLPLPSIYTY